MARKLLHHNSEKLKQEFITSTGKAIIDGNMLYLKERIAVRLRLVAGILLPVFFIIKFITHLSEAQSPKRNVGLVISGFCILLWSSIILIDLFTKVFSNRIALHQVVSAKTQKNDKGVTTLVVLKLHSGKEKEISFYKQETQLAGFIKALSLNGLAVNAD